MAVNFNSIKVRLERTQKATVEIQLTNFNSIKVRLELAVLGNVGHVSTFQFHKGTIRTLFEDWDTADTKHFNSIKVRLELDTALFEHSRQSQISIP